MEFKKFNVEDIAKNLCVQGIIPESFLPTLKSNLVSKCVTTSVVVDFEEIETEDGDWEEIEIKEQYAIVVLKSSTYRDRHNIMPRCDEWFPETGFPTAQLWRLTSDGWLSENYNHWDFLPHGEFFTALVSDNRSTLESIS